MGRPISEEELALRQKITDDRWKAAVALYKKNYPDSEKECQRMCEYMARVCCETAQHLFAVAMMKMHMEIATETGELLGPFEKDKDETDPSRN